ncbi:MAG TPA: zf-HC2 domain-containing protein [Solirubrobacter sp.]
MSTHLEHDWLVRYARGELDQARSFSVEAHLPACSECRAAVAGLVDTRRLARTWDAIEDAIDAPPRTLVERVLVRAGVGEPTARLLAVTPALRLSWLAAIAIVLTLAVVSARARGAEGVMVFLLVAPLLPLAGVAAAYGPLVDPAFELTLAAPLGSFRLLVLRAVAVVAVTALIAAGAALALPGLDWTVAAWLLPSLGLTLAGLGLATSVGPTVSSLLVAGLWVFVVIGAWQASGDPLSAFGDAGQLVSACVAVAGLAAVLARRDSFDIRSHE